MKIKLTKNLEQNKKILASKIPIGKSFDIIARDMNFGDTEAYWIGINGMYSENIMQLILADLQNPQFTNNLTIKKLEDYVKSKISFSQTKLTDDLDEILRDLVSGPSVIMFDGFSQAIIIDLRKYPVRGIEEPDNEKVLKGSKDGFVETMLFNANLIRRRVRNAKLTFEVASVGSDSKTDVTIAYIGGITDEKMLKTIRQKIKNIDVSSLTMGEKSLEELLVKPRWFNPMPCIQTTERPDVACSYLMEGNALVIVDNSPVVIILPCTVFQFLQNPEDYYKGPVAGNFYRFIRFLCVILSLYILPTFLLIAGHMPEFSSKIQLIKSGQIGPTKMLLFVIFAEFGLDLLKHSAAHSVDAFSSPLSIIGGLIVSDIAVQLEWVSVEIIFYAGVTLLTTMAVSNVDFADALKIYRLLLIVATGTFGIIGFVIGNILMFISVITTPTFANKSYFWPLVPFNWQALKTLLFRVPTFKAQPENVWNRRTKTH